MTQAVIWLIAFAVIFYLCYTRWDVSVSRGLDKMLPSVMETHGDNRLVWSLALAIIGATTVVRPVDILLMAILIGLAALIGIKLVGWVKNKADFH
ncbi:hypothetical protein KG088_12505 [Halomonas sp. TRM85114]|uniref:hypothetical protein n=1 Tax=Halomonas jincaotanensis TaxID=2810616 RepID=UPI001BD478A2|nr:hypothetical protein [Halomonas jincaotanensis]MBS9404453.1 hypothetical protein [Halomonas jincaotanensis]